MAEMDFKKRQDRSAQDLKRMRLDFKLKKRKKNRGDNMEQKESTKSNPRVQPLDQQEKMLKKKKKKCWCCGSMNNLKIDCPIKKEK